MLPGLEMMGCQNLAVPAEVMQHVVNVESSRNPFAIGVVGGQLVRQPQNIDEAVATVRMLEDKGYNYSLGAAQINRANLGKFGLDTYEKAFEYCPNLAAGSRILAQCYTSAGGDWGKAFSCYYSGNFTTGYQDGYVQKIYDSMSRSGTVAQAIPLQTAKSQSKVVIVNDGTSSIMKDSPAYRVAMRSVLDAAGSVAAARIISAVEPVSRTQPSIATDRAAATPMSSLDEDALTKLLPAALVDADNVGQALRPSREDSMPQSTTGRIPTDPSTASVMSQIGVSAASPAGNAALAPANASPEQGVFVPQVRGPNDAALPGAATSPPAKPAQDGADLRVGARDDAFVF